MSSTAVSSTIEEQYPHRRQTLSVTTIGVFLAFVNSSIVLISLPAIFRGLHLDPLLPGNVGYLLWMLIGYLVVTSVFVVTAGRLGDLFGRARCYTAGFVVFTLGALLCALTPSTGGAGAVELITFRCLQGFGGALLMANSTAILTDVFPPHQRGTAVGINQVAGISGSFLGLLIGGLLADSGWRLVFWVSVVPGVFGTFWAARTLRDRAPRRRVSLDLWGNATFAVGLVALLVGISYGIQPYGGSDNGWGNPFVLGAIVGGLVLLGVFVLVERRVAQPMFAMSLFGIRAFSMGNAAGLLAAVSRGGLQFMLIIWLQGVWLPLHGYSFADTPLWAGIYLLPLTVGFLVAGPASGWLSDRYGARPFATGGALLMGLSFALLLLLPADFSYPVFALLLMMNGMGSGLFASPNTTGIMNAVPADQRGVASGMRATFQNSGMVLSIGLFFSLLVVGLSGSLPHALSSGLQAHGVPAAAAAHAAATPPVGTLFAAFLGFNPIHSLLGAHTLAGLPAGQASYLTGTRFFPSVMSGPFLDGLTVVFTLAIVLCVVAAAASWARGGRYIADEGDGVRDLEEAGEQAVLVAVDAGVRA